VGKLLAIKKIEESRKGKEKRNNIIQVMKNKKYTDRYLQIIIICVLFKFHTEKLNLYVKKKEVIKVMSKAYRRKPCIIDLTFTYFITKTVGKSK